MDLSVLTSFLGLGGLLGNLGKSSSAGDMQQFIQQYTQQNNLDSKTNNQFSSVTDNLNELINQTRTETRKATKRQAQLDAEQLEQSKQQTKLGELQIKSAQQQLELTEEQRTQTKRSTDLQNKAAERQNALLDDQLAQNKINRQSANNDLREQTFNKANAQLAALEEEKLKREKNISNLENNVTMTFDHYQSIKKEVGSVSGKPAYSWSINPAAQGKYTDQNNLEEIRTERLNSARQIWVRATEARNTNRDRLNEIDTLMRQLRKTSSSGLVTPINYSNETQSPAPSPATAA